MAPIDSVALATKALASQGMWKVWILQSWVWWAKYRTHSLNDQSISPLAKSTTCTQYQQPSIRASYSYGRPDDRWVNRFLPRDKFRRTVGRCKRCIGSKSVHLYWYSPFSCYYEVVKSTEQALNRGLEKLRWVNAYIASSSLSFASDGFLMTYCAGLCKWKMCMARWKNGVPARSNTEAVTVWIK